ncbi:MAG: AMP-binding protein [Rhodospirillaceae bacterium]|jgi:acyl-CoA synthetase (AMP-forming)/AMP-acid ligase II|nr:AMP-binding protein [Rhodospirillaceae bacterium]MBT6117916.1 AMP-binding protein [Rhodospirillaceae bacterium]
MADERANNLRLVPPPDEVRRLTEALSLPDSIGDFIRERAAALGEKRAWHFFADGDEITYAGLDRETDRIAAGLLEKGLAGPGDHVGIMLPNRVEWPLTWLALMKLGAVVVPINIGYTAREVGYILDNADVSAVVLGEEHLPILAAVEGPRPDSARTIVVGAAPEGFAAWADLRAAAPAGPFAPPVEIAADRLATIQYTSGTTGFPKGVMLDHRYWLIGSQNAIAEARFLGIERTLLCHAFHYMAGQHFLLAGLHLGAELAIAPRLSIRNWMVWAREHRAQFGLVTGPLLNQAPTPEDGENEIKMLVLSYGFTAERHDEIERRFGCHVRNVYGMTENMMALYVPIHAPTASLGPGAVGILAPYREVRIVDEKGEDVPDGAPGEIVSRGPGHTQGYYKNAEATATALRGGWMHSGDRGLREADGWHQFLGRMKDVIRRSSENISAIEVESVLVAMDGIERAACVAVPDDKRGEEVKAYLVLKAGFTPETVPPATVLAHCEANLAAFKIPRFLTYREELPTTASDKVEKHKLVAETKDLRAGSYDRETDAWI